MTSLEIKRQKTKEWKERHREEVLTYQRDYYHTNKDKERSGIQPLRECKCGVVALTEDDLTLFEIDPASKHGHRNRCLVCAALKARKGRAKLPLKKTCPQCKQTYVGELNIDKAFRRAAPTGDKVIGGLIPICKSCEFPEEHYYEIDGKFIPKEIKKSLSIHTRPQEAL